MNDEDIANFKQASAEFDASQIENELDQIEKQRLIVRADDQGVNTQLSETDRRAKLLETLTAYLKCFKKLSQEK